MITRTVKLTGGEDELEIERHGDYLVIMPRRETDYPKPFILSLRDAEELVRYLTEAMAEESGTASR